MKKIISFLLVAVMSISLLAGCSSSTDDSASTEIEKLSVYFVPSRDPEEIVTATEPLSDLLIDALAEEGYTVDEVEITVGTTYEAVGEALTAGTADVGFIPGGTYVLYKDGVDVLLTATRAGLTKDSSEAAEWNDGTATEGTDEQVTYYKGLILAGPSEKGQELAEKVNNGEELTFDDLNSANWGVRSTTSSSGYIYPSLWLNENYGKNISDLTTAVQTDSYASSIAQLASGQVDVITVYADARRDYADAWSSEYGKSDIWTETSVIGVTENIYNDTISARSDLDDGLKEALQNAFISIASTEEGAEVISIYSHEGYQVAEESDYDGEVEAQELIKSLNE